MMRESDSRRRGGLSAPHRKFASQRSAATLIELLGTLSVLLVLGISAASILGSITQVGVRSTRAMQSRAAVERLAKAFRQDVRQASEISVSESPVAFDMAIESLTVRYQWDEKLGSIRRTTSSDGEKQLTYDTFQVPHHFEPVFELTDDLVVLRLIDVDGTQGRGRRWVIEAIR